MCIRDVPSYKFCPEFNPYQQVECRHCNYIPSKEKKQFLNYIATKINEKHWSANPQHTFIMKGTTVVNEYCTLHLP